ncbi:MAG: phytoene desaturase family protein, partial [Pseudorhodoplanes sp.]
SNGSQPRSYDVIVVGGGHNGLVAAAYLARAGLRVLVAEAREVLGGPVGTYEFMPGYKTPFTNSPGSFEPRIMQDLDLETHGLHFFRPDPTLVHRFETSTMIGWRDRAKVEDQLNRYSPDEAERYNRLVADIEEMGAALRISLFEPGRDLDRARANLTPKQAALFDQVFYGSLKDLLDSRLKSVEAKALLGMVALNVTCARPSSPGTAMGLILRPLSIASSADGATEDKRHDPRRSALRGATGLPVGGMGAIADALESYCRSHGVDIRRAARVKHILSENGRVAGIVTDKGETFLAPAVVSSINPQLAFRMLDDKAVPPGMRADIDKLPMMGSAFKLVLALDRIPRYVGLPDGLPNEIAAATQFRIAWSLDEFEDRIRDAQEGRVTDRPLIWGLIPSIVSPQLAPPGKHVLSANIWHVPYQPREGDWASLKERFVQNSIDRIADLMPDIRECITGYSAMTPVELESELSLVRSHITHGNMLTAQLFGPRPHALANDYRTPLKGFYLSGAGTWPGGYVTGVPGLNASRTILRDLGKN